MFFMLGLSFLFPLVLLLFISFDDAIRVEPMGQDKTQKHRNCITRAFMISVLLQILLG
jgi:hypothetical protein